MSEEFSAGVNILLQRMETHPEEFFVHGVSVGRDPKWHSVMVSVLQVKAKENPRGEASYLTDAEVDALYEGYRKIRRKAFDDYVMDTVLNPEPKLSSEADARAKMQSLQTQFGQQKLRVSTANNDINTYGLQGLYDVDTHQYHNAINQLSPQNQAVAHAQHIAAHQEAIARSGQNLMNANPYQSSQGSHPQPMSESMLSKMAKGLGFK
jgi:hypothetical protein